MRDMLGGLLVIVAFLIIIAEAKYSTRKLIGYVLDSAVIVLLILVIPPLLRRAGLRSSANVIGTLLIAAVLMFAYATVKLRLRRKQLTASGASFGFHPADASDVCLTSYPMRRHGTVRAAMQGESRGLDTWIFDYSIADGEDTTEQTVIAFRKRNVNLPMFQLLPPGGLSVWLADDRYIDEVHFDDVPDFEEHFRLKTSATEGIRRYFTTDLLATLLRLEDCGAVVQGCSDTIVFFNPGTTVPVTELEAWLNKCAAIAYALFTAPSSALVSKLSSG
jgi:hypothetical protein